MIGELLEVPLWCLECVMTRTEAEHVLAICVIGRQLQALFTLARANLRSCRIVDDALQAAAARQHTLPRVCHALLPVSEAVVESLTESRQQLLLAIGDCLEKLQAQQAALELFISQHSATADELENAGCMKEAARRRFLVAVETQMVHNILVLLRQATSVDAAAAAVSGCPSLRGAVPLASHCKEMWSQLFDGFEEPAPPVTKTPAVPAPGAHNSGSSDDQLQSHLLLPMDRLAQSVRRPPSRQSNPANTPHTPMIRAYAFTSSSSSSATEKGPSEQCPWTGNSEKRSAADANESQSATPVRVRTQDDTRQERDDQGNVGYEGDNDLSGTQPTTKRQRNEGVTLSELFAGAPTATPQVVASQASDHTMLNDTQTNEQLQTLVADADDDGPETQPDADDRTCLVQSTSSQTQDPPLTGSDSSSQDCFAIARPRFISQPRAVETRNPTSSAVPVRQLRRMSRMNTM